VKPTDNQIHGHMDEITALLFLEGQLEHPRAREVSAHAAGCPACGALLRALERESRQFSQAMIEEDEPLPLRLLDAAPAGAWAREVQTGKPAAPAAWASWVPYTWALSFALIAAACYTAWTDIIEPWTDQLDQTGIQGSSLLIRLTLSGLFWEGWTTVLNTLQYAVWTLLGVGVLVLLRHRLRRPAGVAVVVAGLALFLALPTPASAAEVRRGSDIAVPPGETIQNDLIVMGARVLIDGTVNGDVIAFTQNLAVNGHVTGDVIVFGDMARVSGVVDGNVRCFCNTLTLDGTVGKNLTAFAARVELNPRSVVNGGMIAFARSVVADGKVNRDLLFFSADTFINGSVGGDVWLRGGRLSLGPSASIAGRFQVRSDRQPDISAGAKLGRALEFQLMPQRPNRFRLTGLYLLRQIVSYGVAFLCGLLLIKLFPGLFFAARDAARRVGLAMSIGALVLICGLALILFSILLVLAGAGAGFATLMLYAPVLYGSQVFVGAWIGDQIGGKQRGKLPGDTASVGALALGLLILRILGVIPFFGFFVWAAVLLWGTGAICMALWKRTRLDAITAAV